MTPKINLHKSVSHDDTHLQSFALTLKVERTEGVSPCIFVHQYFPKSPYTGSESYEFHHTAYLDELYSIPDYVEDKKHTCFVRRSCLIYTFECEDELNQFVAQVLNDVKRLATQVDTADTGKSCEQISVTPDDITTTAVSCTPDSTEPEPEYPEEEEETSSSSLSDDTEVIVLSLDN